MRPELRSERSPGRSLTPRIAEVEQFCSWSAWRMKSTSSAFSMTGFGVYFVSVILNNMFKKLPE